ncbi:MAG: hypothetical protein ACE5GA_11530, partial [Candidatus Zixiibacteriota bacterium]
IPFVFFREELQRLFEHHGFRSPRYGLSLPSNQTALRTLRLPKMSSDELERAVYFEGDKKTPFRLEDAYWNYRIAEELFTGNSREYNISLLAVSSAYVDERLAFFRELGVEFDFIYQDAEALGFSLRHMPSFDESRPYGLLNIRPTYTHISLYQGSRLKFMHRGGIGSVAFGSGGPNIAEAEYLLPQLMDNFTEGLVIEIQNCLDFYGTQAGFNDIETFYVYGDLAYSDELIDHLVDRFGVRFIRFPRDPFNDVRLADESLAETIPAVLPALAVATADRRLTDLTDPAIREQRQVKNFKRLALNAAAIALIALAGLWRLSGMQLENALSARDAGAGQIARFERSRAYAGYRIIKQELARQQLIIDRLQQKDSQHHLALKEVAALTPSNVRLNFFEYYPRATGGQSHLSGAVVTPALAPEVSLAEYIGRLDGSPLFTRVGLRQFGKNIKGGVRTVTFTLNLDAEL